MFSVKEKCGLTADLLRAILVIREQEFCEPDHIWPMFYEVLTLKSAVDLRWLRAKSLESSKHFRQFTAKTAFHADSLLWQYHVHIVCRQSVIL